MTPADPADLADLLDADAPRLLAAAQRMQDPALAFEVARTAAARAPAGAELRIDCARLAVRHGKPVTASALLWRAAAAIDPATRGPLSDALAELLAALGRDRTQAADLADALAATPPPAALRDDPQAESLDEAPSAALSAPLMAAASGADVLKDFLAALTLALAAAPPPPANAPAGQIEALETAIRGKPPADVDGAMEEWEALVDSAPADAAAHRAYGRFLLDAGLPFEALEESYYAFLLEPAAEDSRRQLGQAYARLGDTRRAQLFEERDNDRPASARDAPDNAAMEQGMKS